jgi:hypothetical protein
MRYLIQAVCVVAIAFGGGLFAFGSYLEPRFDAGDPLKAMHSMDMNNDTHLWASTARGVGVGFLALGGLGLAVPWINAAVFRDDDHYDAPQQPTPASSP